ncbi:hypothetical protein WDU94_014358 [Cyamophila willieti]
MESRCKCSCKVSSTMWPRRCNSKWTYCEEGGDKLSGRRSRVVYRAKSNKCPPFCQGDIIVQCQRSWHSESPQRRKNKANKKSSNNQVKPQLKPKMRLLKNRTDRRALVMQEFNPGRSKKKPAGSVENFYKRFKQEIRKDLAINKKIKEYSESSANKAYDKYLTSTTVSSRILFRSQSEISN